ncbi:hypothetical protein EON83_23075 [bacterium]|nr:MAG: hypothetical protein EON83_23075 [bacterium]
MSFLSHGPTRVPFLSAPVFSPLVRNFKSVILLPLTLCVSTFIATGTAMAAVPAGGTPYAWGANDLGQLGNGANANSSVPVKTLTTGVLAGKTITQIAEGSNFTVALCSDGTLASWGNNGNGELGNGTTTSSNVPVLVNRSGVLAGKTVTQIAAGNSFCLVLCSDKKVYSWGLNSSGQLGNATNTNSSVPVAVSTAGILSSKNVEAISAGGSHAMVLCEDKTLVVWGNNAQKQLGLGLGNSTVNEPTTVNTSGTLQTRTASKLAAGYDFSLVTCTDGSLVSWGNNDGGQLGTGSAGGTVSLPTLVSSSGVLSGKTVTAIAAGYGHCVALCSDGNIATWGYNGAGQLGNGSTTNTATPVLVNRAGVLASKTVIEIAAGLSHTVALCTDGTVADWGNNSNGELGNNSTTSSSSPVLVDKTGVLQGKAVSHLMKGGLGTHTLVLGPGNNAPVVTTVTITPTTVKTETLLTATPTATDADSDPLTYTYQWKKGGSNLVGETTNKLNLATVGNGNKGDSITVTVTANDGKENSAPFTSSPVIVGNTAPVVTQVSLVWLTTQNTNGTVRANIASSDADGADTISYSYVWKKNDIIIPGQTTDTLNLATAGNGDKGDVITATVTANDGTDDSAPLTSAGTTVENTAPVATGVSISPTTPGTNSLLTATVAATDADSSDTLSYTYQWKKGGSDIPGATGQTLDLSVAGNGNKGDVITVTAIASDGTASSSAVTSAGVTIGNSAPVVTGVDITPANPTTNSLLTAAPTSTDADSGDTLSYTYQWQKNDVNIPGATNSTLDLSVTGNGNKGDKLKVLVIVTDGTSNSPLYTSSEVTVGNTAPVATGVSISPTNPTTATLLTATPAGTDADSDTLTFTYIWKKNGAPIAGQTGNTLNLATAGNGDKGDVISVSAVASDGTASSSAVTSAGVTVLNTAPVATGVSISPTSPDTDAVVTATVAATDADGSDILTYTYVWKKNGNVISGQTGKTLDLSVAGNGDAGDVISVTAIASDGTASSSAVTSSGVTITTVSPTLQVTSATLNPSRPQTDSVVAARVSGSGPRGAKLTYSYQWKKNGAELVGETGSTIDLGKPGNGDRNDTLSVVVRVSDGTGTSAPLESAVSVIVNASPRVSSVSISPASPSTNSVLTATTIATDVDGDAIYFTYVWYKNGVQISGESGSTLDLSKPGRGDDGDAITVLVKARDYSAASAPLTSAPVTVGGTPDSPNSAGRSSSPAPSAPSAGNS